MGIEAAAAAAAAFVEAIADFAADAAATVAPAEGGEVIAPSIADSYGGETYWKDGVGWAWRPTPGPEGTEPEITGPSRVIEPDTTPGSTWRPSVVSTDPAATYVVPILNEAPQPTTPIAPPPIAPPPAAASGGTGPTNDPVPAQRPRTSPEPSSPESQPTSDPTARPSTDSGSSAGARQAQPRPEKRGQRQKTERQETQPRSRKDGGGQRTPSSEGRKRRHAPSRPPLPGQPSPLTSASTQKPESELERRHRAAKEILNNDEKPPWVRFGPAENRSDPEHRRRVLAVINYCLYAASSVNPKTGDAQTTLKEQLDAARSKCIELRVNAGPDTTRSLVGRDAERAITGMQAPVWEWIDPVYDAVKWALNPQEPSSTDPPSARGGEGWLHWGGQYREMFLEGHMNENVLAPEPTGGPGEPPLP